MVCGHRRFAAGVADVWTVPVVLPSSTAPNPPVPCRRHYHDGHGIAGSNRTDQGLQRATRR